MELKGKLGLAFEVPVSYISVPGFDASLWLLDCS